LHHFHTLFLALRTDANTMKKEETIDSYIANYPHNVQLLLQQVREAIGRAAPGAVETISYGMPAFKLHKVLVYFAAYNNHIGFYPTASGIKAFEKDLATYKWSKGAVQFPIDKAMPVKLIAKIVAFRVKETTLPAQQT
jgi:uncharacterized protein YdhG (YjbR/CyaY superfamily)